MREPGVAGYRLPAGDDGVPQEGENNWGEETGSHLRFYLHRLDKVRQF